MTIEEPVEEPEGPVGITDHELAALVDMSNTPAGRMALDAVGVLPMLEDEPSLRAGYSTLLVRDLAGIDGEMIVAQDVALAIAAMMTTATDAVRLVIGHDGDTAARTVFFTAPEGSFLLDMTVFGVHAAHALAPGQDILTLVWDVVGGMVQEGELPMPFEVSVTRLLPSGQETSVEMEVVAPDSWRLRSAGGIAVDGTPERIGAQARSSLGY